MVLSLLYGKKYNRSRIDTIELDATITEEHRFVARVTNFPLEDGQYISDHVINEPDYVSISGVVSDTPFNFLSQGNRSIEAFNNLIQIHKEKRIITIVTGIKVYQNMIMTVLDVPRSIKTGQSLTFNLEFQKVLLDTFIRNTIEAASLFVSTQENVPREIISSNDNIPLLQLDPPNSLRDQAQTGVDAGVQSLQNVPETNLNRYQEQAIFINGGS